MPPTLTAVSPRRFLLTVHSWGRNLSRKSSRKRADDLCESLRRTLPGHFGPQSERLAQAADLLETGGDDGEPGASAEARAPQATAQATAPKAEATGAAAEAEARAESHGFMLLLLHDASQRCANGMPGLLTRALFTRQVSLCALLALRRFRMESRAFLGLTPIKTELAWVLNNLAQVSRGSAVLDPYCGTGSLLLPASALGALSFGADINPK
jgi:hypothetical protein